MVCGIKCCDRQWVCSVKRRWSDEDSNDDDDDDENEDKTIFMERELW